MFIEWVEFMQEQDYDGLADVGGDDDDLDAALAPMQTPAECELVIDGEKMGYNPNPVTA